jgi:DNA-binding beta-propeller fold protein YncE
VAYLSQISDFGFKDGGVFRPNGIAADVNNNIYISDVFLGVVYVFKPDGTYISPVMSNGEVIKFKTPSRIRINNNRLYVLETLKNTISVYELL